MTRKHYETFASHVRGMLANGDITQREALVAVDLFAGVAAADNPRFDRARFYKACGVAG